MSQWLEYAALVAGSGVLGVVVTKFFDRDKDEAEETQLNADALRSFVDSAVLLVAPLQDQVTRLSGRVEALELENRETKTKLQLAVGHIRVLLAWIAGQIPDKTPPSPPSELGV